MEHLDAGDDLRQLSSDSTPGQADYPASWTNNWDGMPPPSLFSSGLPASSVPSLAGSNQHLTPQSALSSSTSSRSLAALSGRHSGAPRRSARFEDDITLVTGSSGQMSRAEKDADDPSTPADAGAPREYTYTTPTALSRLLGAEVATTSGLSPSPSYNQSVPNLPVRCNYQACPSRDGQDR